MAIFLLPQGWNKLSFYFNLISNKKQGNSYQFSLQTFPSILAYSYLFYYKNSTNTDAYLKVTI